MSFEKLKRKTSNIKDLRESMKENTSSYDDPRMWKLHAPKPEFEGTAVIRLLPPHADESLPYVIRREIQFQDPTTGIWFIENSPSTIGLPCPVTEAVKPLWEGSKREKDIARSRSPSKKYYANILVIDDPAHPENNGKNFIWKFGQSIFDLLSAQIDPKEGEPVNIFDFWEGANFNLDSRIDEETKFVTYKHSYFDKPSVLSEDEDFLKDLYENKIYNLTKEILDPSNFKEYAKLKARYLKAIGESGEESEDDELPAYRKQDKPLDTRPRTEERQPKPQPVDEVEEYEEAEPWDSEPAALPEKQAKPAPAPKPKDDAAESAEDAIKQYEELLAGLQ